MKRFLLCMVAVFTPIVARAGCKPTNLTDDVHIRSFGCSFETVFQVKLADDYRDARKVPGTNYWKVDMNQRIDAVNYPLHITERGFSNCCQSAKEQPVSANRDDCYVEFIVSCDKPEWGMTVASTPQLSFDYERDHPDGFQGWACTRTAPVSGTVTGFGAADQVRILLRRNDVSVLNYPITLPVFLRKPRIPLERHDLEALIDAEAKQGAVNNTPAAREVVATRKKLLPDSITLTKTQ
jgi:hypothetical protein